MSIDKVIPNTVVTESDNIDIVYVQTINKQINLNKKNDKNLKQFDNINDLDVIQNNCRYKEVDKITNRIVERTEKSELPCESPQNRETHNKTNQRTISLSLENFVKGNCTLNENNEINEVIPTEIIDNNIINENDIDLNDFEHCNFINKLDIVNIKNENRVTDSEFLL